MHQAVQMGVMLGLVHRQLIDGPLKGEPPGAGAVCGEKDRAAEQKGVGGQLGRVLQRAQHRAAQILQPGQVAAQAGGNLGRPARGAQGQKRFVQGGSSFLLRGGSRAPASWTRFSGGLGSPAEADKSKK